MLLKIKKEFDLKELEKFGFKKLDIMFNNHISAKNVYCYVAPVDEDLIENNCVDEWSIDLFIYDRHLSFCNYAENVDWDIVLEKVYDLTKAGLLEKVDD